MKRLLSILLILCLTFSVSGVSEGRGTPELNENTDELDALIEEEQFLTDEDSVVFDPEEELMLDEFTLNTAFDTLDNTRNILLLGLDSRSSSISGRTDTIILLNIDIENRKIKIVSFLRDTYVEIPGKKNNRLNSAYVFGGFDLLADTLYKNFGVRADAYVAVNLAGLVDVIDQLGGIDVDIPENKIARVNAVIYWYNIQVLKLKNERDGFLTKGGYQHLNGKQAESWARYRYSESDFERSARQRQLMELLYKKICQMSAGEMISFALNNIGLVKTNISISDLKNLVPAVLALKDSEISGIQIPLRGKYKSEKISGMNVLVPDRQANVSELRKFLAE